MTEQRLKELLRHAYEWGKQNGSNRREKNFKDFLQTEAVRKALSIAEVEGQSEQFKCRNVACNEMVSHRSDDVFCEKHRRKLGI